MDKIACLATQVYVLAKIIEKHPEVFSEEERFAAEDIRDTLTDFCDVDLRGYAGGGKFVDALLEEDEMNFS